MQRTAINVLLADDSPIMRTAIRKALADDARVALVGEAENLFETVQKIKEHKPEVLLLDLHLPEQQVCTPARVKALLQGVCVLAISVANDNEARALAKSYGAVSLLDKMLLCDQVIPAICAAREALFQRENAEAASA